MYKNKQNKITIFIGNFLLSIKLLIFSTSKSFKLNGVYNSVFDNSGIGYIHRCMTLLGVYIGMI